MQFHLVGFVNILFFMLYVIFIGCSCWILFKYLKNVDLIIQEKFKERTLNKFKCVFSLTYFIVLQQQALSLGIISFNNDKAKIIFYAVVYGSYIVFCLALLSLLMRINLKSTNGK